MKTASRLGQGVTREAATTAASTSAWVA